MKQLLQSLKTGEIELAEIPVPQVKAGHLLIEAHRSLISLGTERMLLRFGRSNIIDKARQQPEKVVQVLQKLKTDGIGPTVKAVQNRLDSPMPLGYSHVGVVRQVGGGVEGFVPGDRVVSNGNHSELVCVPVSLCAKIPDAVDDETASFTVLSAIALQGIRLINPTLGESIAILGLGLIGLLAVQILRAHGCRVIGFDFDERKVSLARSFGAEAYALGEGSDPVSLAHSFSSGYGVDGVVITAATKSDDPIHQAPQMCRKRGRLVLIGVVGLHLSRDDFYKKEISFQVSCSYGPGRYEEGYEKKGLDYPIGYVRWTEQRNFEAVLQLMAEGKISAKELVSDRFPFERAEEAYEKVIAGGDALGIILEYPGNIDLEKKTVQYANVSVKARAAKAVVGFIGAGGFASSTLIPAFQAAGARLKTVASAGGISGFHTGRKFGFEANTTDYKELLQDSGINTVVVATQHNTHAKMVIDALSAGKHVFVEKPLCIKREELEEIRSIYEQCAGRSQLLMVGFNRRFSPLVGRAGELLSRVREPRCFVMTVNAGAIPAEHWTQSPEAGGGRIIGEGCHFIDLLRFLAQSPFASINSVFIGSQGGNTVASDKVTITCTFGDGSIGAIHYFANGHRSFPKERLEVFCGGTVLQLDNFKSLTGFGWKGFKSMKLASQDKGHRACVRTFVQAIEQGAASPILFSEIVEVTEATFVSAGMMP